MLSMSPLLKPAALTMKSTSTYYCCELFLMANSIPHLFWLSLEILLTTVLYSTAQSWAFSSIRLAQAETLRELSPHSWTMTKGNLNLDSSRYLAGGISHYSTVQGCSGRGIFLSLQTSSLVKTLKQSAGFPRTQLDPSSSTNFLYQQVSIFNLSMIAYGSPLSRQGIANRVGLTLLEWGQNFKVLIDCFSNFIHYSVGISRQRAPPACRWHIGGPLTRLSPFQNSILLTPCSDSLRAVVAPAMPPPIIPTVYYIQLCAYISDKKHQKPFSVQIRKFRGQTLQRGPAFTGWKVCQIKSHGKIKCFFSQRRAFDLNRHQRHLESLVWACERRHPNIFVLEDKIAGRVCVTQLKQSSCYIIRWHNIIRPCNQNNVGAVTAISSCLISYELQQMRQKKGSAVGVPIRKVRKYQYDQFFQSTSLRKGCCRISSQVSLSSGFLFSRQLMNEMASADMQVGYSIFLLSTQNNLCFTLRMLAMVSFRLTWQKGALPTISSQASTPRHHRSTDRSYSAPSRISGAAQSKVPQQVFLRSSHTVAQPKSHSLHTPPDMTTFSGLMSRCTIPFSCMYTTALAICFSFIAASGSVSFFFFLSSEYRVPYYMYSRIKYTFSWSSNTPQISRIFLCLRKVWSFTSRVNWATIMLSLIIFLGIFFRAQMLLVLMWQALKTVPNLPPPSLVSRMKSSMVTAFLWLGEITFLTCTLGVQPRLAFSRLGLESGLGVQKSCPIFLRNPLSNSMWADELQGIFSVSEVRLPCLLGSYNLPFSSLNFLSYQMKQAVVCTLEAILSYFQLPQVLRLPAQTGDD